jgi:hypothetical protein
MPEDKPLTADEVLAHGHADVRGGPSVTASEGVPPAPSTSTAGANIASGTGNTRYARGRSQAGAFDGVPDEELDLRPQDIARRQLLQRCAQRGFSARKAAKSTGISYEIVAAIYRDRSFKALVSRPSKMRLITPTPRSG